MSWPQWTWIGLAAITWLYAVVKHGEPKTGISARNDAGMTTAGLGLSIFLLWQGGFFGG